MRVLTDGWTGRWTGGRTDATKRIISLLRLSYAANKKTYFFYYTKPAFSTTSPEQNTRAYHVLPSCG